MNERAFALWVTVWLRTQLGHLALVFLQVAVGAMIGVVVGYVIGVAYE